MTSQPHVTAVVVTFNRVELLGQCLEALAAQVRPPDAVVVVDNASSDRTPQLLAEYAERGTLPGLEVLRLPENTGGAGGFAAGMGRALERGTDWVWTMDDDVAPDPDCLHALLSHTDISECVQPQRIRPDGEMQAWEPIASAATMTTTFLDNVSFANGKDLAFTNVVCFEGSLISARIVELVGLPDPDYFIVGDDTVFGLKASVHTNIVIARDARMRRLLDLSSLMPWKVYYATRNAFLVRNEACAYLGITPSRVHNVIFGLNLALEMSRHARRGRAFVGPVLRGFRDGVRASRGTGGALPAGPHHPREHAPRLADPSPRA